MKKLKGYQLLFKIKEDFNIDIEDYIKLLAENEIVPNNVLRFINKYISQPELFTFDTIYAKRKKNPLYKNLVNEKSSIEDKALALSSLLTQIMIRLKELRNNNENEEIIQNYIETMEVNKITNALSKYTEGDCNFLNNVFMEIRSKIKELHNSND